MPELFKILHPAAIIPNRATKGSAGWDLYAHEAFSLQPGERTLIKIGIAAKFPVDVAMQIQSRSGLAMRGVMAFHGLVDSDYYPNDIGVILTNYGAEAVDFKAGDRIAQAVFLQLYGPSVDCGQQSERIAGFGSTG